jgi:hypothetical protein
MIRPVTRNLWESIWMDEWPRMAAICDFGLNTQEHYEALYYPIRKEEISIDQLEAVLGNGKKITELVQKCEHNPHKQIIFKTAYDDMTPEPEEGSNYLMDDNFAGSGINPLDD